MRRVPTTQTAIVLWSIAVLVLAACGGGAPSSGPSASIAEGVPRGTPGASAVAPSATSMAERCSGVAAVMHHDAPTLEAALPKRLAGRDLATWSVAGRCWFEILVDEDAIIDGILADVGGGSAVDLTHLAQAVAGRSDTAADPPYFVFAANRPENQNEVDLTLFLLLGGAAFRDVEMGANLDNYEEVTIAGKQVYAGTTDMIDQTDHQRGKPYLYQTDTAMFIVITDDPTWAEEAFAQLP